ncbi:hypothetical protein BGAL_0755g00040 [Botrytis galanthina]|uniref:Uncharacterized protein n=1 Tax=Botrytis galanthina TaxID=278940 RepID=A0A4S8QHN6_9HELO|nr:hypothetical protein BGAL_0755g00040 [Botrytis galanthina]
MSTPAPPKDLFDFLFRSPLRIHLLDAQESAPGPVLSSEPEPTSQMVTVPGHCNLVEWSERHDAEVAPGEHDVAGTDVAGTDVAGTDVAGTDVAGTDVAGTDVAGTDVSGTVGPHIVAASLDDPLIDNHLNHGHQCLGPEYELVGWSDHVWALVMRKVAEELAYHLTASLHEFA